MTIIMNLYSAKTIEEYSKARYIKLKLMKRNQPRIKNQESTIRGHRKTLSPRWDSNLRPSD